MSDRPTLDVRIAMWSGPRNISTAMMRAFENRDDCVVRDEPFYACYLAATGVDHPLRDAVLASQPTDWEAVVRALEAPLPAGVTLEYQKHMTHHMVVDPDPRWLQGLRHAFLVRNPADMVASYVSKRASVTPADLGLARQVELHQLVTEVTGQTPPVLDARDVLEAPEAALRALCAALDIGFSEKMLRWPPGFRDSDGVWAPHWYNAVAASSGFGAYTVHDLPLSASHQAVVDACRADYEYFIARRIVGTD